MPLSKSRRERGNSCCQAAGPPTEQLGEYFNYFMISWRLGSSVATSRLADLLGEVVAFTDLLHKLELGFQPVHVTFRVDEDVGQQVFAAVVTRVPTRLNALVELRDGRRLEGKVVPQDLEDTLPDGQLAELLQVGQPVEKENALDQLVGVLHLVDRLLVDLLAEVLVPPVRTHLGVEEVLADGRELAGQDVVQQIDDSGVALHEDDENTRRRPGASDHRSGSGRSTASHASTPPLPMRCEAVARTTTQLHGS